MRTEESLYSAVYGEAFDPRDPRRNYVADGGVTGNGAYGFEAEARQTYVVVVVQTSPLARDTAYELTLSGSSCVPWLEINPAQGDDVVLRWPTSARAHQLESRSSLVASTLIRWFPQDPPPVVLEGQYNTTNDTDSSRTRFSQLRQL